MAGFYVLAVIDAMKQSVISNIDSAQIVVQVTPSNSVITEFSISIPHGNYLTEERQNVGGRKYIFCILLQGSEPPKFIYRDSFCLLPCASLKLLFDNLL